MYQINFNKPVKIHFMGIGGISMSGLAEILHAKGFTVVGSDAHESAITDHLTSLGIQIAYGQRAENITPDIDVVVYTAAIHPDNPEFAAAKSAGLPMMDRAELLGQIMTNYTNAIAVSGTHGKTTTTSMLSHILLAADTDPTISVGGILKAIHGNIRVGHSNNFITEACEYTNSFLKFNPSLEIILISSRISTTSVILSASLQRSLTQTTFLLSMVRSAMYLRSQTVCHVISLPTV